MRGLSQAALVFELMLVVAIPSAHAQPYPSKTIEIVVSYGAGGSTDLIARAIAQKLQDRLGQSVVVLNKPGASGTIGVTHIPYRGGAQAVGDLTGGHIDLFYGGVSAAKGAIDAGLVKPIALVGAMD